MVENQERLSKDSSSGPGVSPEKIQQAPNKPADDSTTATSDVEAAAVTEIAQPLYLTGIKLWLILCSVTVIAFLMLLDMSIIVTAIPRITNEFHSLQDVGWYGSAYLLASCGLQPLAGKLYTHLNSKSTFLFFLGLFEIGSALCGAAQSSTMLIIGRAVAGLGGSGLTNGALTILARSAPMHKQPLMLGVMMGVSQIGIICGPLVGGAFTEHVSWRWCFYINLPVGAAACILLLAIHIPDRPDVKNSGGSILTKLDLRGFTLFASFAVMTSLALEWGGSEYAWNSAVVIGLFCGGGVALVIFAAWESRIGDRAMIPYSVVGKREVWSSCVYVALFGGAMLTFSYYLPIYFQAVKGVGPLLSGIYMLSGILPQMLMAVVSGALVGKLGYYLPWAVVSAILACISAGLVSTFTPDTLTVQWVMYQFIGGVGRGCGMQTAIIAIQNTLPPHQASLGMSLAIFSQTYGSSLILTFAKIIFSQGLGSGLAWFAPTVDPQIILGAGATAFRQLVSPGELVGVLQAYSLAIDRVFYLAAGASGATFVVCWGMGWHKITKTKA